MDAKGSAARGGQVAACLFLARNLVFPIQVDCKAVTLVARASRRRTTKQAPALGPRAIYVLCWLTEFGDSQFVRCHAARWLALVHFALRLINAQRSCILSMVDDVVRGSCDLDAKMSAGEQSGRPMWAYRTAATCAGRIYGSTYYYICVTHLHAHHPYRTQVRTWKIPTTSCATLP